jgi:hypothetical protein
MGVRRGAMFMVETGCSRAPSSADSGAPAHRRRDHKTRLPLYLHCDPNFLTLALAYLDSQCPMLRSYEETDYANARRRLYASQQLARSGLLLQLSGAWRNTERTGGRPRVATEVPVGTRKTGMAIKNG